MKLYTPHTVSGRTSIGKVKVGVHAMRMPKMGKMPKFKMTAPKMSRAKIKI